MPDHPSWAVGILTDGLISALPEGWEGVKVPKQKTGSRLGWLRRSGEHFDVVYCWMWHFTRKFYRDFHSWFPDSKLMVGCTGYKRFRGKAWRGIMRSGQIDGVNTWAKVMYDVIKDDHPNVQLTRHGIDHNIFVPGPEPDVPFRVGWCGNVTHSMKQCDVLTKLDFPVVMHGRHLRAIDAPNIIKDRKRLPYKDMGAFYRTHHAYVCVSKGETGPLPILEAAAAGLPVVSTAVGVAPELLDPEWVIDERLDKEVIAREMNKRLHILADDAELRAEVGRRNRAEIEANWTWEACIDNWINFFESV